MSSLPNLLVKNTAIGKHISNAAWWCAAGCGNIYTANTPTNQREDVEIIDQFCCFKTVVHKFLCKLF